MKSPFPGMDPFIEGCGLWEDFHAHLIEEIGASLNRAVPQNYLVRMGVRRYIVLTDGERSKDHPFLPDVSVTRSPNGSTQSAGVAETATLESPLSMQAFVEEEFREKFVEIFEATGERRLVTCIEVLSPSNKRANSPGWDLYQRKRMSFFESRTANLIEIDLIRGGQRMPMVDAWPDCPGTVLVARKQEMPHCKIWPSYSLRPLSTFPVPLFKPDADVRLDLQSLIDGIYAEWRYDSDIDYTKPLAPPLTADETVWLAEQLRLTQSPRE